MRRRVETPGCNMSESTDTLWLDVVTPPVVGLRPITVQSKELATSLSIRLQPASLTCWSAKIPVI